MSQSSLQALRGSVQKALAESAVAKQLNLPEQDIEEFWVDYLAQVAVLGCQHNNGLASNIAHGFTVLEAIHVDETGYPFPTELDVSEESLNVQIFMRHVTPVFKAEGVL